MRGGSHRLLIRDFIPDDAVSLLAIHQRAIMATSDRFYTREQRQSWAEGLTPEGYLETAADGEIFDVAVLDAQVVAFCSRKGGAVIGLYVDPSQQGCGIGHALLERAETAFRRDGASLTEIRASLPAVGFYEKEGYAVVADETHPSRGGLPLAIKVMSKRLS